jgi:hypothetical protein
MSPGPFYFAWVPPGTPFSADLQVFDEEVFSVDISQSEGDFAALSMEIKNPGIGLLAPSRLVWGWLSWDNGTTVVPLFFGRLVAVPGNLHQEIITIEFTAKPSDYHDRKAALAATMRVRPWWDQIWVGQGNPTDDDKVLETRAEHWDTDRVTLDFTAVDIIAGSAGLVDVSESQHSYDQMSVTIGEAPLVAVDVSGTVSWEQTGTGDVDFTRRLVGEFQHGGSYLESPLIVTLTGDGLKGSWPNPNGTAGGGYKWALDNTIEEATWIKPLVKVIHYTMAPPPPDPNQPAQVSITFGDTVSFTTFLGLMRAEFPISVFKIKAKLTWEAKRKRNEIVTFRVTADVQPVMTDPDGTDVEKIELTSDLIDKQADEDGQLPIGDLRRNTYFKIDRGRDSLEYLILLARAKLLARARCIDIEFETTWEIGIGISCRNTVRLHDRRLPGGQAVGKIKHYRLGMRDGEQIAQITIACTVGYGNSVSAVEGTNVYSDGSYDVPGEYEQQAGVEYALIPGRSITRASMISRSSTTA